MGKHLGSALWEAASDANLAASSSDTTHGAPTYANHLDTPSSYEKKKVKYCTPTRNLTPHCMSILNPVSFPRSFELCLAYVSNSLSILFHLSKSLLKSYFPLVILDLLSQALLRQMAGLLKSHLFFPVCFNIITFVYYFRLAVCESFAEK